MTDTMGVLKIIKWVFEEVYISIRFFFPVYAGLESRAILLIFLLSFLNAHSILMILNRLEMLQFVMIALASASLVLLIVVISFIKKEYYEYLDEQVSKRKTGALLFVFIWIILSIGLWTSLL
jgi:hypothetical protein